jgi:hypothetical protein
MIGLIMSNVPSVVADAVASVFVLSAELSERVAVAAEMAMDSAFDFRKSCDSIASVFGAVKSDGVLNFDSWEVVRKKWEAVASVRARDNGALDPDGAANDRWQDVSKFLREFHGLTKPKSAKSDSVEKAQRRAAEKDKALAQAQGRSAVELQTEVLAAYGLGTPDGVAHAKALEKVQKIVAVVEKDAIDAQMKPLINAANDQHKKVMEYLKGKNDPKLIGDYVVLLKSTIDAWESLSK